MNIQEVSKLIEDSSYVYTVNYSDNWTYVHFSDYLGYNKPVILDENYEADQDYFPLKWYNRPQRINQDNCNIPYPNEIKKHYLFILGTNKERSKACLDSIGIHNKLPLEQIIENNEIALYKIK
jgi:hypothetical protein